MSESQKEEMEAIKGMADDVTHQVNSLKLELQNTLTCNGELKEENNRFKDDFRYVV